MEIVDSPEHWALARELARRSITLVRDDAGLLPLRLGSDARVAAIMPLPKDLTPADTSSTVVPMLAQALRLHHSRVESFVTGHPPLVAEIAGLVGQARTFDLFVIGTISASLDPQQAALVNALLRTGVPVVTVALRTPWDLGAYPAASTHLCTYGIHRPSLDALADVLWGAAPPVGHLPVSIQGIAARGHGLSLTQRADPILVGAAHANPAP
jgi:beta-N-acetylhexosaminidase